MTDVLGLTTIATFYQAGNGIFDQFDKILVLDEGQQLFYGRREDAVPFMEELGFYCDPAANKADFLTSVTVASERRIRQGFEDRFPRSAAEIRAAYERGVIKSTMLTECEYPLSNEAKQNTAAFQEMVASEANPRLPKKSVTSAGPYTQVKTSVIRQFQILWGDKATLLLKQGSATIQA